VSGNLNCGLKRVLKNSESISQRLKAALILWPVAGTKVPAYQMREFFGAT